MREELIMTSEMIWKVVEIIVSLLVGGGIGFKIGITVNKNKIIKQNQKGGSNATMTQIGEIRRG